MIPLCLDSVEVELRCVIARCQTGDALTLIAVYGNLAAGQIKQLAPDDSGGPQLCAHVISVLNWASYMLQAHRSSIAEELRSIQKASRFLNTRPESIPVFGLDL
jgi:hypothetical protein